MQSFNKKSKSMDGLIILSLKNTNFNISYRSGRRDSSEQPLKIFVKHLLADDHHEDSPGPDAAGILSVIITHKTYRKSLLPALPVLTRSCHGNTARGSYAMIKLT